MKISEVLNTKGTHIEFAAPSVTVSEIVDIFQRRNISSVVITADEGQAHGIVTDRYILRALAQIGRNALMLTARAVMHAPAPFCTLDDNLSYAMRVMTERRVRHLLVREGGRTCGIVSIGDLVKCRIRDVELENNVLRDMALSHIVAKHSFA